MNKDICCPKFDPKKWDKKTYRWKNKPFIKGSTPLLFHIPFPPLMGRTIVRMMKNTTEAKAEIKKMEDVLLLMHDPSPWKSELYLSVKKKVPNEKNVTLTGTFMSKVFDGPYNAVPRFMKEMGKYLKSKKKKMGKTYVHYAYCPKCVKKYKHNYAVLFVKV
jgi:predicted Ser/Thr protein kinase